MTNNDEQHFQKTHVHSTYRRVQTMATVAPIHCQYPMLTLKDGLNFCITQSKWINEIDLSAHSCRKYGVQI
jgi:hypothetical protein